MPGEGRIKQKTDGALRCAESESVVLKESGAEGAVRSPKERASILQISGTACDRSEAGAGTVSEERRRESVVVVAAGVPDSVRGAGVIVEEAGSALRIGVRASEDAGIDAEQAQVLSAEVHETNRLSTRRPRAMAAESTSSMRPASPS